MTAERHYCHQTEDSVLTHADAIALAVQSLVEIDAAQVVSGTFPDARIAASNVTQHRVAAATGWVYLSSQTASTSAQIDFTGLTAYSAYQVRIVSALPDTDNVAFDMRVDSDNGASFDSGNNYQYVLRGANFSGTTQNIGSAGSVAAITMIGNTSGWNMNSGNVLTAWSGVVNLWFMGSGTERFMCESTMSGTDNTGATFQEHRGTGRWLTAAQVNAVRFMCSTGNIASGVFRLYGLKDS